MSKAMLDAILDAMLDAAEGSHITICSAQPSSYADIVNVDLTGSAALGSLTAANGDTSGRKNTYPAVTGISITATGDADHIAVHNNSDTLHFVTTCASQSLTSGGAVDTAAFDHELGDPT